VPKESFMAFLHELDAAIGKEESKETSEK
ncbi:MAG: GTP-binding protein, partial [Methanolobus sp. T82-4]